MKIGIFGGCFNPPHNMHKKIATGLIEKKLLDKVIFVPTGNKYNKKDLISDKDRYNMLKLICEDNHNLEVSDYEFKADLTYTYQTLDYFKGTYPNDTIYFILGTDNFLEIETWKNYEYILENYRFLILYRSNYNIDNVVDKYIKNSSNITQVEISKEVISSTLIRELIRNKCDHELLRDYLDDKVIEYIDNHHLYE